MASRAVAVVAALALVAPSGVAAVPSITNLRQTAQTLETITIAWDLDPPTPLPDTYTLLIDDLINQFPAPADNTHTATQLLPCTTYDFKLTATLDGVESLPAELMATTEYSTPQATGDLTLSEDKSTLTWTAPANAECVDHYKVCWRSTNLQKDYCVETTEPSLSLDVMSGCDSVKVQVVAVNPEGKEGPEAVTEFDTAYGDPGAPQNFTVVPLPNFAAQLTWDLPEENPACIAKAVVEEGAVDGEETRLSFTQSFQPHLRDIDEEAIIYNLTACTEYQFSVYFLSITNATSEKATDTMTTEYVSPGMIQGLNFTTSTTSMKVNWTDSVQDNCIAYVKVCYSDSITHEKKCVDDNSPQLNNSVTIDGLSPCRHYTVIVSAVSITGEIGPAEANDVKMEDTAPGPVTNLLTEEITTTSIRISYDPPVDRPECAYSYVVSHKQEFFEDLAATKHRAELAASTRPRGINATRPYHANGRRASSQPRSEGSIVDTITGLYSCSYYRIEVYAVSGEDQAGLRQQVQDRTHDEPPFEATELKTEVKTDSSITSTWFAPTNRFCVDWYKIRADTAELQGEEVTFTDEHHALEHLQTFSDLQSCTPHTIVVQTGNDLGVSTVSYQETTEC